MPGQPAAGRGPHRRGRGQRPRRAGRSRRNGQDRAGAARLARHSGRSAGAHFCARPRARQRMARPARRGRHQRGAADRRLAAGDPRHVRCARQDVPRDARRDQLRWRMGGTAIDPVLDIAAEVATADITAQAVLHGPVSAPKLTLTSSPAVPQDEILARVLFGRGLGQITAGEGLQVAAAAANLAGGGFDVLDKVRGGLGLDRLGFGSVANRLTGSPPKPVAGGAASGSRAQRRQICRRWGLCRRVAGTDAGIEQGRRRDRGAAARHDPGRCQPERQHRHRAQLQIRLLRAAIARLRRRGRCRDWPGRSR